MIRIRNVDDFEVYVSDPGTQSTGKKYFFTAPFDCWLKAMYAKVGTAGTTGTQTTDINDEGSSIFASGGIAFASAAVNPTYAALTNDPHFFSKGDRIDVTNDAVNTTPATDLSVVLVFSRVKPRRVLTGQIDQALGF
ncbi:hypothetical protein LCGC14_1226580 [marine sediment metagenome]|uniref:Uncharacterized protein n=1 Tax=marine sediment metagenome TaxID=412755 RepID=A0A0F9L9P3_9ZZZZ